MSQGLHLHYTRTGPLHPSRQVSVQTMFERQWGTVLPAAEILALCAEHGITDARIENGTVVARHQIPSWGEAPLETALQVERLAADRTARAARLGA